MGYSDPPFGETLAISSELGCIVRTADKTDNVIPLGFKSYKSKYFAVKHSELK